MKTKAIVVMSMLLAGAVLPPAARSHCDTMDGPVVVDAQRALEKKDVTPVLKWVTEADEAIIRRAFSKTVAVRETNSAVRELADQFFFETLVRVHRAGEGAPYTGLKPAGSEVEPGIREADEALEKKEVADLVHSLQNEVTTGVQRRFAKVLQAKQHSDHNVEAGRKFVAAYVDYVHYVEGLHRQLEGQPQGGCSGNHSEAADTEATSASPAPAAAASPAQHSH